MHIEDGDFNINCGKVYHELKEFHFQFVILQFPELKFPTLKFYEGDERHQKEFGETTEPRLGRKGTVQKIRRKMERYMIKVTSLMYDDPEYAYFMIPNMSPSPS